VSTPQAIAFPAPRFRFRQATLLTALGVLVAIAASIAIIALTSGGHPAAATTPVGVSAAATSSVPETHYLGPSQIAAAALAPQSTQLQAVGTTATANASNTRLYTCLGAAQRCLR
jgi:hypothetical protein